MLRRRRVFSGSVASMARASAATTTPLQVLRPSFQPLGTDQEKRPSASGVTRASTSKLGTVGMLISRAYRRAGASVKARLAALTPLRESGSRFIHVGTPGSPGGRAKSVERLLTDGVVRSGYR
jgi:hypothetical protein